MSRTPAGLLEQYTHAIAAAYVQHMGRDRAMDVEVDHLASFFHQRFAREARRLPREGRDEFLSAVALEILSRIQQAEPQRYTSANALEDSFRRAITTVLDTVRHRLGRTRSKIQSRERPVEQHTEQLATSSGDFGTLLYREIVERLSATEAAVLYLVVAGHTVGEIAQKLEFSPRTIFRLLQGIRRVVREVHHPGSGDAAADVPEIGNVET